MSHIKDIKVGDSKIVSADINEKSFVSKERVKISKNDEVVVLDKNGNKSVFYVHRIMGKSFVVLKETRKKPKLGIVDSIHLGYEAVVKRGF